MKITRWGGAGAVLGLAVGGLALAAPAHAQDGHFPEAGWFVQDTDSTGARTAAALSSAVDDTTVELVGTGTPAPPHYGTSAETTNLGLPVAAGDVVSVDYELLDGASPAAGAVRLFIYDHPDADTNGVAPTAFVAAPDDGSTSGTLSITVGFDGEIGTAGVVYDSSNGGVGGTVRFSNLTVGGELVLFQAPPEPEPGDELNCDDFATQEEAQAELDADPSDPHGLDADADGIACEGLPSGEPAPGEGGEDDDEGLPVTGLSTGMLAAGGALLLAIGGGAYLLARRRRMSFTA